MTDGTDLAENSGAAAERVGAAPVRTGFSRRRRIALAGGGLLLAATGGLWLARGAIATRVIDHNLAAIDLPATYVIESIGPGVEVLRDVVVGDPHRPDLTIARLELYPAYGISGPRIGRLKVTGARLFGRVVDGQPRFGALDRILFAPADPAAPLRLPDWELDLVDARGLVDSAAGRLAFKAEGQGNLRSGFGGSLALLVPSAQVAGCSSGRLSYYGQVSIRDERPRLAGPLRIGEVVCPATGVALHGAQTQLALTADRDFKGVVLDAGGRTGALALGDSRIASLALDAGLAWRANALSGRVSARAEQVREPRLSAGLLAVDGLIHSRAGFATMQVRGTVSGQDVRHGPALERTLADARHAADGTLAAPLLARLQAALGHEEVGSRLAGEFVWKGDSTPAARGWSLTLPDLVLRGRSGQRLLSGSRLQVAAAGTGPLRLAGEFATGGPGLPQIFGRFDRDNGGADANVLRARLEPYGDGADRVAVPDLTLRPARDGGLTLTGAAQASGRLPGGSVRNLVLPLEARVSLRGDLALWTRCVAPAFDSLVLGSLALDRQRLGLCPAAPAQAIVRAGAADLRVAARMPALALSGRLGDAPLAVTSGPLVLAYGRGPGHVTATGLAVLLGGGQSANRLRLDTLDARIDGAVLGGRFAGLAAQLAAVPADLAHGSGQWRFADGRLTVIDAQADIADREKTARFEPLQARGATLTLADNRVEAEARLHAPKTGGEVVHAVVRHDLGSAVGHADLMIDGLTFEDRKDNSGLQPADLSKLALGVVANAAGTVTGKGRIDWKGEKLTSSGRFGTTGLDLAAAFGPVKGLSGTLDFTDLIGMATAPHQLLKVASVNPGIEVNDGVVDLQLLPDQVVVLNSARWPFLGGKLSLEPAVLHLAQTETRRFTLVIERLDAARFLDRMDMSNLSATGTFDGRLPLEFVGDKGRIVGGNLVSRAPGGTVAYVGALSYKDLTPMANYAFAALKAMDYRTMVISMQGDLAGEIVTNVRFGGIKQGQAASKNFVTRQIAALPIQFNVNIRAQFLQLITSLKSMYDPASVRDPRTLGLIDARGVPLHAAPATVQNAATLPSAAADIQPSVIGSRP